MNSPRLRRFHATTVHHALIGDFKYLYRLRRMDRWSLKQKIILLYGLSIAISYIYFGLAISQLRTCTIRHGLMRPSDSGACNTHVSGPLLWFYMGFDAESPHR